MTDDGVTQAAVLLLAMGEDAAAEVFKNLAPKEVQRIGETMAQVRVTNRGLVTDVLKRFHVEAESQSSLVADSGEYVRNVLNRALGEEKAGLLIDRILQGGDASGIESLKWMDAVSIAELIRNEHPQIIASILVHLERDHAAEILLQFGERVRGDVVFRIATLEGIQPNALRELNDVLSKLLSGGDRVKRGSLGGAKSAAEIMNYFGSGADAPVLEWVREHDPELAQKIMDQMFTFADLINLDDRGVQLLLREVQSDSLVIALKGAEPELREKIFKNMSSRAAETLREDLESKGPVKVSEVDAEQKEILKVVRRLADEGQLSLGGGGGDDAYV